jgi:hypothetical protein
MISPLLYTMSLVQNPANECPTVGDQAHEKQTPAAEQDKSSRKKADDTKVPSAASHKKSL